MKLVSKKIMLLLSLAFALPILAGDGTTEIETPEGIFMTKTVTQQPNADNEYTITLETFVTGTKVTTVTQTVEPMDITLILDRSVSVNSNAYSYVFGPEMLAATAFANSLYDEKNRPKDENGNLGYHYVAAFSMFTAGIYNDFMSGPNDFITDVNNNTNEDLLKFTEFNETNKDALVANYTKYKNDGGSYKKGQNVMQVALQRAIDLYSGDTSGRGKVIVIFTAGGSMQQSQGGGNGEMDYPLSIESINLAHQLKEMGVTIYVVSIEAAKTSPSPKGHTNDLLRYYHYLSSNYNLSIPDADKSTYVFDKNYPTAGGGDELADYNADHYYRTGKSTEAAALAKELEDIFKAIAQESTSGGATYELTESSVMVFDVLSNYFRLPDGVSATNITENIQTYKVPVKSVSTVDGKEVPEFYELDRTNHKTTAEDGISITLSDGNKGIRVTGFDFAENYCGLEKKDGKETPHGNKLVIEIPITVDNANPGGATLFTNEPQSGIYVTDKEGKEVPVAVFTRPTLSLPNIIVRAFGLGLYESASYTVYKIKTEIDEESIGANGDDSAYNFKGQYNDNVYDPTFTPIHVILTKTRDDQEPTAKIKLNNEGRYKVVEDTWAYTYSLTLRSTYFADEDNRRDLSVYTDKNTTKTYGGNAIVRTICNGTEAHVNDDPDTAEKAPFAGDGTLFDFTHIRSDIKASHRGEAARSNWKTALVSDSDDTGEGDGTSEETPIEEESLN